MSERVSVIIMRSRKLNMKSSPNRINHAAEHSAINEVVLVIRYSLQISTMKRLFYFSILTLLLILQTPKETLCVRRITTSDTTDQYHSSNYRHYQETPSDATDILPDSSDPSPYESTGASEGDPLPAPNDLSVIRINDTSVVLRWEFPPEDQDHLQFFKLQHRSMSRKLPGSDEWKTVNQDILVNTRAYQINGLRPGSWQFKVAAVYDNEDHITSTPFKFRIRARNKIKYEEMPEMKAPEIYFTVTESDYFRIKWHYEPKQEDVQYFGYLVYYRSAHLVTEFSIYNTLEANVEVAEVEPDTPYEAMVVAYNHHATSNFSEMISVRTKPRNNLTSTEVPPTTNSSTTITTTITSSSTTRRPLPPNIPSIISPQPGNSTNQTPIIKPATNSTSNNSTDFYQSIIALFEPLFNDQSDAILIVRYLLLALLPLLFIIIVLLFVIKPHKGEKNSPESTSSQESMQFDLEINGYFKNSFPGVENQYSPVCMSAHIGFVNNHPHIDDSK